MTTAVSNVRMVQGPPPRALSVELEIFERQFTYPLGPDRSFRIQHATDYSRFFRAMGQGACFVAEQDGRVVGTLGVALRRLLTPEGDDEPAGYLGDLKVTPSARGGSALVELLAAASAWDVPRPDIIYGVVMAGTTYSPPAPVIGELTVFHIDTREGPAPDRVPIHSVAAMFPQLSIGRYAAPVWRPNERSSVPPVGLALRDGSACGLVEDTRRAKRLLDDRGTELVSAHLSDFAYRSPKAGAEVVRRALAAASTLGAPQLFVAVCTADAAAFRAELWGHTWAEAGAAVHGIGLEPHRDWNISTAEI